MTPKNTFNHPNQKYSNEFVSLFLSLYKTRTMIEVASLLDLSLMEAKSVLRTIYAGCDHKIKDSRLKSPWNLDQKKFLVKNAGIISRKNISIALNRGHSMHSAKEELKRLGVKSERLHGLCLSEAQLLGDIEWRPITTQKQRYQRLITWLELESNESKMYPDLKQIKSCIRAMARFQRWLFGVKTESQLRNKLIRSIEEYG